MFWTIGRNAITVGAALTVVSLLAAFLFHRFRRVTWRNVAFIAGMLGAILVLYGDVVTRQFTTATEQEKLLEQPLRSGDVAFRLVLRPDVGSTKVSLRTNAVIFMAAEEVVLVSTHPMSRNGESPEGLITLTANLDMEEARPAVGQPVADLNRVDRLVIAATPIPFPSSIVEGEVTCTFNGNVVIKVPVHGAYQASDGTVVVDLEKGLLAAGGV